MQGTHLPQPSTSPQNPEQKVGLGRGVGFLGPEAASAGAVECSLSATVSVGRWGGATHSGLLENQTFNFYQYGSWTSFG